MAYLRKPRLATVRGPRRLETASFEEAVRSLVRSGARAGQLLADEDLLPVVDLLVPPSDEDTLRGGQRAIRAQEIITQAIEGVGGEYAEIMRILLQIAPGTPGTSIRDRRTACGQVFSPPITHKTFERNHEKKILRLLAVEILAIVKEDAAA
ncbi:hypothetical protein LO762_10695 [Actinocorallia sp. API 0066]|uniref:hypothetical protein n=1 Tax=Actinocorallia sp. API 0066 TaxID=2896846 RepID=UPI001E47B09C|nr:hypothetical protein [Actinocorallia sp. API 0066]MCD0449653.1 hypothetical protein [Actinocorallia sp. API 0066]